MTDQTTQEAAPEATPEVEATERITNAQCAAAFIRTQLEDGPKTLKELRAIAEEGNPAQYDHPSKPGVKVPLGTKDIVEQELVGEVMPGNAAGYYFTEGFGEVAVVVDNDTGLRSLA